MSLVFGRLQQKFFFPGKGIVFTLGLDSSDALSELKSFRRICLDAIFFLK